MTYTEVVASVDASLTWLGYLQVGLAIGQGLGLLAVWVLVRERMGILAREVARLREDGHHPSPEARALTEAQVSVDEAVREIQAARSEIRAAAGEARAVAALVGVEHVTAEGPARG